MPTHPELLDWLAVEFRDGGQSLKALHRQIVTSHTYRQASAVGDVQQSEIARAVAEDADNRYLWQMARRKLDAESVRDSVLMIAGSWIARWEDRRFGISFWKARTFPPL